MLFGVDVVFWHWWILALVFIALEMTASAYFFLWLAGSSAILGIVLLVMPDLALEPQLGIWAALSTISITFWYTQRRKNFPEGTQEDLQLNQRGKQIVGRKFTLAQPIENGEGKVNVDDSWWKVECDTDMAAGEKVEVTAVTGTVLVVKPLA